MTITYSAFNMVKPIMILMTSKTMVPNKVMKMTLKMALMILIVMTTMVLCR